MKLFCIIQGPLITYGQGPNNIKEGYRAAQSILANIDTIKINNIDYLFVTWHPKNIDEEIELNLLAEKNINLKLLNPPNIIDPDHRFKHHFSIKCALDSINLENYEFILKLRSDQIITSECIDNLINRNSDRLIVSELMNGNSFYVGDFIYFAKTKIFIEFIDSQLIKCHFLHPVIANDIGFKYFLFKTNKSYISILFYYLFNQKKSNQDWISFSDSFIETLRLKDWNQMLWRGNQISNIISSTPFYFSDTKHVNMNVTNFKIFIFGLLTLIKKYNAKIFN